MAPKHGHEQPRAQHGTKLFGLSSEVQLVGCIVGIYSFYLIFGMLQEQISAKEFGEKDERFKYTAFLLFIQSIVNCLVALLVLKIGRFPADKTPFKDYALVSLSSIAAHFCSSKAILFVDYPTQVLAKSCKPIPVMLMGLIAFKKRYTLAKYAAVLIITFGIALFMLNPPAAHPHSNASVPAHRPPKDAPLEQAPVSLIGLGLLLTSLALDGITGPFQEVLVAKTNPSSTHLMFFSCVWQSIFMGVVVVATGDIVPAVRFIVRFPQLIPMIILYSLTSACGQVFIYYTVHQFGSLLCTIVTTSRKFFTILASVVWFDHKLYAVHWLSIALVFVGLVADILMAKKVHITGLINAIMRRKSPTNQGKKVE